VLSLAVAVLYLVRSTARDLRPFLRPWTVPS
jgi:hypothetical protein